MAPYAVPCIIHGFLCMTENIANVRRDVLLNFRMRPLPRKSQGLYLEWP